MIEVLKIGETAISVPEQFVGFAQGAVVVYGIFIFLIFCFIVWVFITVIKGF